jgi:predicted RNase H-like HicB family nuclease
MAERTVTFNAEVVQEDDWHVARCLDVEVASQGGSPDDALGNLRMALELYFEDAAVPEIATIPNVAHVEVRLPHAS